MERSSGIGSIASWQLERNITIKLGYANAKIYCAVNKSTPRPDCYKSFGSQTPDDYVDPKTKVRYHLRRHVSFVDCPGHDILMATMLNGAAVMDAALLLVAGNEPCPQPQVPIIRTLSLSLRSADLMDIIFRVKYPFNRAQIRSMHLIHAHSLFVYVRWPRDGR